MSDDHIEDRYLDKETQEGRAIIVALNALTNTAATLHAMTRLSAYGLAQACIVTACNIVQNSDVDPASFAEIMRGYAGRIEAGELVVSEVVPESEKN